MPTRGLPLQPGRSTALDLRVLEAIADGQPLEAVLSLIAVGLEQLVVGWRVSILLLSPDDTLTHGAAPSLPEAYIRAIDGERIGPAAGSCGTAAFTREIVAVQDIATDPRWEAYREVALAHGLRACWSVPVLGGSGEVLATFAVYHTAPFIPAPAHLELVRRFVHLARVAIQNDLAHRQLRASEEQFRAVFRDAGIGLSIADMTGRFTHTNPAFQLMLGYTEEELMQLGLLDVTHPDDRAGNLVPLEEVRQGRRDSFVLVKRYIARDGRVLWAHVTVTATHDAAGRVTGTVALASDITRERAAEQERRLQQSVLQMASRLGRLGAWSLDVDSNAPRLSEDALAIYELPPDAAITVSDFRRVFDTQQLPRLRAAFDACVTHGTPFDEELRLTTRSGRVRWVRLIGEALRDESGRVVKLQGAVQDITERKRHEQQSLRSQRLESIGTLAGGIAHDLNNVLTPIAMAVGVLQQGEHDEGRLQILGVLEQSAKRAANMVQQVLSFARGAEGHRSRVDPRKVVGDVAALLTDTLPKHIRLEIDVAEDVLPVDADPTQLHQVLLNLCVNARDAMPDGGTLRITASNVVGKPGEAPGGASLRRVCFSVQDEGQGIHPDVLDKIFDPFFTTKPPGQGTGLGLSTSLAIVHAHGGVIDVASTPGQGTRFDVVLPAAASAGAVEDAPGDTDDVAGGHGVVLIVDDEPAVRLMSRHVLQRSGYRVLEASSGDEALAMLSRHGRDIVVVLTDMMMPGMDGPALIRAIGGRGTGVPVIGMSGIGVPERLTAAEVASLGGFLQKPFTPETLLAAVHRALHGGDADQAPHDPARSLG